MKTLGKNLAEFLAMVVPTEVECPYCKSAAELVGGDVIYPHLPWLHDKKFWMCAPCDAYVWLANKMGLQEGSVHIGEFDEGQCAVAIKACQKWRDELHSVTLTHNTKQ